MVPKVSWFSYISFPRARRLRGGAGKMRSCPRSGSVTGGFRPGRFFELAFHAGQAEKEDPPEADGKERNYERNGEQLLERFQFAHESFRDEERLKRAKRNHVQAKAKRDARPQESRTPGPRFQLK